MAYVVGESASIEFGIQGISWSVAAFIFGSDVKAGDLTESVVAQNGNSTAVTLLEAKLRGMVLGIRIGALLLDAAEERIQPALLRIRGARLTGNVDGRVCIDRFVKLRSFQPNISDGDQEILRNLVLYRQIPLLVIRSSKT